ncbi:AAA family ATPase [Priestia aryabhattai]|uniref:ParA family protein n=1 Tax=Priestia aryabhattai TaxID=412384 RepID=UPI002E1A61E6|nr:AAA family ATPase [Priestia aryabhattai]
MTKIISSMNMKGGVGKTTLIKYLSILSVQHGKKTLVIDLCQNSDVSTQFQYNREDFVYTVKNWMTNECTFEQVVQHDKETGVDFIPSNRYVDKIEEYVREEYFDTKLALKDKIDSIPVNYDYIFIDTHPSETNLMIVLPLGTSDLVLIPSKLNYSSVVGMERTIQMVEKAQKSGLNIKYGVVPMAVDAFKMGPELDDFKTFLNEQGITPFPIVKYTVMFDKLSFRGEELSSDKNRYSLQVMETFENVYERMEEML